jgi:GT2 family glycosyltransferase
MRARLLGWKAWYVPTAVVRHRHSATAGAYSPVKVMLVERNRLLLAVKNLPLPLLLQNPFWTVRRFAWYAYAASRRRGSAARFVEHQGWLRMLLSLIRAYAGAARLLPGALRRRRHIQGTKRLSNREVMDLLRRFRLDLRDLTLND